MFLFIIYLTIQIIKLSKRYECNSIAFAKALTNAGTPSKFLRLSVYIFIFLYSTLYFIGIQIFNNGRRKFSKIPLDSAYKYATRSHNAKAKRVIMNERSE